MSHIALVVADTTTTATFDDFVVAGHAMACALAFGMTVNATPNSDGTITVTSYRTEDPT